MFHNSLGVIYRVEHLVDYHAYWDEDDNGNRVRNAQWNADCKHLLNLKNPAERRFPEAVQYFTNAAAKRLAQIGLPPINLRVHIVVVPSSTAGNWSAGLMQIGHNLMRSNRNFVDSIKVLPRIRTIEKLAHGGDRSVATHEASIGLNDPERELRRKTILLLDDITTTGNSLAACASILQQSAECAQIIPMALGKTV